MNQNRKGQLGGKVGQEWPRVWGRLRSLYFNAKTQALQLLRGRGKEGHRRRNKVKVKVRATYNGAGIDVVTPRRTALHFQFDAGVVICAEPPNGLLAPGLCHSAWTRSPATSPQPRIAPSRGRGQASPLLTYRAGSQDGGSS